MANTFAIITAVLLAASAFVAFKNDAKYKEEVKGLKKAENSLTINQAKLEQFQDERDEAIDDRKGVEEETVALRETEAAQQKKNSETQAQIKAKKEESETNAQKISEIDEKTKEIGEIEDIAGKIKRLQEEIASYADDKAAKEVERSNLLAEKSSTEKTIQGYSQINSNVTNQRSYFDSARITEIHPSFGFVILSAGNNTGAVANSPLDVMRGGEVIAKLRVRSVEANRASADIVPDSLSEDVTLIVGDKVVPGSGASVQASN